MCGYRTDQLGEARVSGLRLPEQIVGQNGIGQLEEAFKERSSVRVGRCEVAARKALEQDIELLHATTAAPQQTPGLRIHQSWRSTSIFLISAMAFAGFRSFGQASVQFMIVWHR